MQTSYCTITPQILGLIPKYLIYKTLHKNAGIPRGYDEAFWPSWNSRRGTEVF